MSARPSRNPATTAKSKPTSPVAIQLTPPDDAPTPIRLITVSLPELDDALRRDRGVELVRAPDAYGALGELSDPIDESSPRDAVIAIPVGALAPNRAAEFVRAARRIDPGVRVVAVGEATEAGAFDEVITLTGSEPPLRWRLRPPGFAPVRESPEPHHPPDDPETIERCTPIAADGAELGWVRTSRTSAEQHDAVAARCARWLAVAQQLSAARRAALIDEVTGAYNRRYFERFMPAAIERARRRRGHVVVMLFDIDNFKRFNDSYGHQAGDEILRATVDMLKSATRPTDRVCRVGGDEFVVVFDDPGGPRRPGSSPLRSIRRIARRFQQQVATARFAALGAEAPGELSVSGGLAAYPWDGASASELLAIADQLALQSKREGKNAIRFGPGADRLCGADNTGDDA